MPTGPQPPQVFAPASGLLGPSSGGQLLDMLRVNRESSRHYSGFHFSNLATLYKGAQNDPSIGTPPILFNSNNVEAWTEYHLRSELLPFIFGSLNQTYLIFSMSEWNGYWWLKPKQGWTYPYSHTVGAQGKWWFDWFQAGSFPGYENVDNILVALEEAAKWSGRRIVIGTGRGDDIQLLNDIFRKEVGSSVVVSGSLTIQPPAPDALPSAPVYAQLTTPVNVFFSHQVGMVVSVDNGNGAGIITQFVAPTLVGIRITESFDSLNLAAGNWRLLDPDMITNGAALDFADSVKRNPATQVRVTASKDSFLQLHDEQEIYNRFGPGRAKIKNVVSPREVDVEIIESWAAGSSNTTASVPYKSVPHHWRITGILPLLEAMTIVDRQTKAAAETLDIINLAHSHFKDYPAFDGFYLAHEPDHLASAANFIRMICVTGVTYQNVFREPLKSYRKHDGGALSFWVAPSSPIDVQTVEGAMSTGAALADSGLTHLHPQDTTGAGADILTGKLNWNQGIDNNIAQLPQMAYLMQIVAARAGCVLAMHNEVWEMKGTDYANPYPADKARVKRQFRAYGNRGALAVAYQAVGYISQPGWSIKPRQNQAGIDDFGTRAINLANGLVEMVRDPFAAT